MNKKGSLISTGLMALSMVLFLISIFCFFGPLVKFPTGVDNPNMWMFMFDHSHATYTQVTRLSGITAVFAFQMIITTLIIVLILSYLKRFNSVPLTIVIVSLIVVSSLVSLILSFNGLNLYEKAYGTTGTLNATLGSGAVAYSVLHIIALVSLVSGGVLSRRGL